VEIIGFIIGLVIGIAVAGVALSRRLAAAIAGRAEARAELAAAHDALARERDHHSSLLDAEREAAERQLTELRRGTEEKMHLLAGNREQLEAQMKAISAGVLKETSEQLAKLADESRKVDREQLKGAVEPVSTHLKRLEAQVTELERERKQTHGTVAQMFRTVTEQVETLRKETGTLVNALRKPQVRGAWGEMQLRNCVEAANMTAHVDFDEQRTFTDSEGGRLRPDMTVRLPGGKSIVVDSKVPLDAYLAAYDATDDLVRDAELDRHARQVRTHLDALASKSYHAQLDDSPELVICFIPNEAVYCAAVDRDPTLFEHGMSRNVLVATPTTLVALLKSAYYGWRQETLADSAREIADAARELHKRVATFMEPFAKVGRQLRSTVDAYNQSAGSLEARVLPQLRRMEEAGAGSEKALAEAAPIDSVPRIVAAVADDGDEPPALTRAA
jgi:DNA recombination protein RmuC